MPYYKRHEDCTNKSGEKGTFVTIKKDGGKRQCWNSEAAFKRSVAARHANESDEMGKEQLKEKKIMKLTKRQLKSVIKEEKRKLLRESRQDAEEGLFNALDEFVTALYDQAGERVPTPELKAEVLNFVDGYFEDTDYAAEQAEREEGLAAGQGFKNPSYG